MPEGVFAMVVLIVLITTVGGIYRKKYQSGSNVSEDALAQIQAELNELKKSVDEIKEYVADLYIQQHDQK